METKDEAVKEQTADELEEVQAAPDDAEDADVPVVSDTEDSDADEEALTSETAVETVFEGYGVASDDEDYDDDDDDELETDDSLTYSNGVIEKIVAIATREVPHILGMKGNLFHTIQEQFVGESLTKGVSVDVTDDNRVMVNISVIIEYGSYAPQIFEDVKKNVTESLASMTGLEVAGINLRIENVVTREEYEQSQRRFINSRKSTSDKAEEPEAGDEPEAEDADAIDANPEVLDA